MAINRQRLSKMLLCVAKLWQKKSAELNESNASFGNGDHWLNMDKIAKLIKGKVNAWEEDESFGDFLDCLGHGIMNISGGSAGPLYGALICGLAEPLSDEDDIDGPKLKEMLAEALNELKGVSKAQADDKTMMDAVIPAVNAAQAAGTNPAAILAAAAKAAQAVAADSRRQAAKFGQVKNCGEKSPGCPDPSALSAALFFRGMSEGFK